jgi:hypothetical protein
MLWADPSLFIGLMLNGSLLPGTQFLSQPLPTFQSHRCKIILISGFGEKVAYSNF